MCDVVDEYVGESIVYITKWLKISEALAGVTLLALANGAGDLITAIVSAESEEGVNYNIGALFGAGLFVISIVLTFTIKNASEKPIKVDPECIYRDVLMYILGVLTVIAIGIYGWITWWTSVIMLLEYCALVATVVW
jgi:sodium/potassium/calcium exchanger 6